LSKSEPPSYVGKKASGVGNAVSTVSSPYSIGGVVVDAWVLGVGSNVSKFCVHAATVTAA
jgi:hypothetical protein